ncbi:hypothetical protein [Cryobacterium sp. PH31-O1]|uniref:hypothetical protein n=1 Tax=Cryobacterium sp. PH31-O1 TaxID=3046306 RepID=UPI0024B9486C|nr:hypothetical protein [Cryobacterium sp. PH31-O1]MDJ0338898.1 hypothetical protein [Cryobacterium sp. PH31-O1]
MANTAKADTANRTAWAVALDALEVSLDEAARIMGGAVSTGPINDSGPTNASGWTPPPHLGALPAEFEERALDLLTNQRKIIAELEQARNVTLKHLTAVRSVPPERNARASVYLDVDG